MLFDTCLSWHCFSDKLTRALALLALQSDRLNGELAKLDDVAFLEGVAIGLEVALGLAQVALDVDSASVIFLRLCLSADNDRDVFVLLCFHDNEIFVSE